MPLTLAPVTTVRTKTSNNEESDRRLTIPYIVYLADGNEVKVEATDPHDATKRVHEMQQELARKFLGRIFDKRSPIESAGKAVTAPSKPAFSFASKDEYVRAAYKGLEARRTLGALSPSLQRDVRDFQASGLVPTQAVVVKWLESRGVSGAVGDLVNDILKYQVAAKDALIV